MLKRFSPSGALHPLIVPAVVVAAVPAAILAWPYQWIVELLATHGGKALVVATFLVPGLGLLTGLLAEKAVTVGKCRSPRVGALTGYFIGAVVLAASHYIAYRSAAGEYTDVTASEYLEAATKTGWTFYGEGPDISGAMVYLMWAAEAGIVLAISGWLGGAAARKPFCEPCGTWANRHLYKATVGSPGKEGVRQLREATTVAQLLTLPPQGPDAGGELGRDHLVYTLRGCPKCGRTATLTVDSWTVIRNIKKQPHPLLETLREDVALQGDDARHATILVRGLVGSAA